MCSLRHDKPNKHRLGFKQMMSAPVRILLIGDEIISFLVRTMMLRMLATVPKMQIMTLM